MRPNDLKTKIFLDSGDPRETEETWRLLGFLDGQTTNPTLIAKNPEVKARFERGEKFNQEEILEFYKRTAKEISSLIFQGSVSIEVYADKNTTVEAMLNQGRLMFSWIPNAHIKLPITQEGLKVAEKAIKEGLRVNMTLCFSQEQAAAVYGATRGVKKGQVFVSPFVGRLDDHGKKGMDLIKNIIEMFKNGDGHVEVLTASVRNLSHLLCAIHLGSDIVTVPLKVLKEWAERSLIIPTDDFKYYPENLEEIPYQQIALSPAWRKFNIAHELTDQGITDFARDWNQPMRKQVSVEHP